MSERREKLDGRPAIVIVVVVGVAVEGEMMVVMSSNVCRFVVKVVVVVVVVVVIVEVVEVVEVAVIVVRFIILCVCHCSFSLILFGFAILHNGCMPARYQSVVCAFCQHSRTNPENRISENCIERLWDFSLIQ